MTLSEYLVAASLVVLGGAITHFFSYLKPKSKLVFWYPHSFLFDRVEGTTSIHTQTYTIQNLGRKHCENIEIIHKNRPDDFRLQPERVYTEVTTPNKEHAIQLASLAPKEFFSVEILSYKQLPQLLMVRSEDGPAQNIQFFVQQVQPKWKSRLAIFLMITGFGTLVYMLIKAGEFIYSLLLA